MWNIHLLALVVSKHQIDNILLLSNLTFLFVGREYVYLRIQRLYSLGKQILGQRIGRARKLKILDHLLVKHVIVKGMIIKKQHHHLRRHRYGLLSWVMQPTEQYWLYRVGRDVNLWLRLMDAIV